MRQLNSKRSKPCSNYRILIKGKNVISLVIRIHLSKRTVSFFFPSEFGVCVRAHARLVYKKLIMISSRYVDVFQTLMPSGKIHYHNCGQQVTRNTRSLLTTRSAMADYAAQT